MCGIIKCYIYIQRNYGTLGNQSFLSIFLFKPYIKLRVVVIIGVFLQTFLCLESPPDTQLHKLSYWTALITSMLSHFLVTILTDTGQKARISPFPFVFIWTAFQIPRI